jgi:hypothetical protein
MQIPGSSKDVGNVKLVFGGLQGEATADRTHKFYIQSRDQSYVPAWLERAGGEYETPITNSLVSAIVRASPMNTLSWNDRQYLLSGGQIA